MSWPRCLTILLALLLAGCASAQPPAAQPPAASAQPAPATATADSWQTIYTRPGFNAADSLDLRAVGDVSLARNIAPVVRRHAPGWLLEQVAPLLDGDVTVGNLESPLVAGVRAETLRPGPYRLPAEPALVDRLAVFSVLSLANNHALDAGPAGLTAAQRTLHEAGIVPLGVRGGSCDDLAGAQLDSPAAVALLAFNAVHDPADRADEAQSCGRAWLDRQALAQVRQQRQASAAPIVVLVHWGDEYATTPSAEQRSWARQLVAAGADLVVGAHPHVVQPAELVEAEGRRGFVAYSLGNFVFDQPDQPATSHSVVLRARLDRDGVGAVMVAPVALGGVQPQPLALSDPAAQALLAAITPQPATPRAWRWDGDSFEEASVPPGTTLPASAPEISADLRGNGQPLRATLHDGLAQLWDGDREVWRNEAAPWQVAGMAAGDADNDGRYEILLRLWKPDAQGTLRSHPFLLGWRGGYYRVFWGGSAVAQPIQDAAIGAIGTGGNALVVLEGGARPGDPATHVGVWTWQGWNFQQQWQSPAGSYRRLALLDLDGDGRLEIVAQ